mmetsp:Transcript_8377/g.12571  ORF Transcript_8377/g.12571 Transcript_8377/m.12571 type:complete len:430 (+) Transcript_8377:109-1398(+)
MSEKESLGKEAGGEKYLGIPLSEHTSIKMPNSNYNSFNVSENTTPARTPVTPKTPAYTADSLRRAAAYVVSIGVVVCVLVTYLEAHSKGLPENPGPASAGAVGWAAVFGALFLFGSVGLMFKEPPDDEGKIPDPVIFQAFNAAGIFVAGLPIIVFQMFYMESTDWFNVLGLIGAIDIIIVSFWASLSTQLIGYAMAPSILNGVGMVASFFLGKLVFREPVENFWGATQAIVVLIAGVGFIAGTQMQALAEKSRDGHHAHEADFRKELLKELGGLGAGIMAGIFDGGLMVPFKLHEAAHGKKMVSTLAYLASFSTGTLMTMPFLYGFAFWRESKSRKIARSIWRKTQRSALPGTITGVIWAMGNFLSVHATKHLGMSIGFPLVQCGILVAAVWGAFFFKDLDLSRHKVLLLFVAGLASLMCGAVLLASFG